MSDSFTFADASPFPSPLVEGGYAQRSDLENIFGIPNIIKWAILSGADPDSPAGQAEVTARINWAIAVSTVDFENAMRQGRYELPVTGPGASIWATGVVARMAGLLLYGHLRPTQRGPDGQPIPHPYADELSYVTLNLDYARSQKLRLDAKVSGKGTNAPFATHERSHAAYGPGQGGYGTGRIPPPGPFAY